MSIEIIDKLKQKNGLTFKLIDLADVDYDGTGISSKEVIDRLMDKEIEIRATSTVIQWKYKDSSIWNDLISISDLKGEKGEDGTSVKILGSYDTKEALNTAHPTGNTVGDGYLVAGNLYVWDGSEFKDCGKIKGDKGDKGDTGDTGTPGLTPYVHIKYSNDGKTFTANNGEDVGAYMGIYVDYNIKDSNNFDDYKWSRIQGQQGLRGLQGEKGDRGIPGTNGITYYTWIKYADDSIGTNISDSPIGKTYIGFAYNKTTPEESTTPTDYTWSKIQGEKGDTGVPGANGSDGTTYYTWIKYSDNSNGNPCYDIPKDTTEYIGIAVNQTSPNESSDYTKYTWSKFKGDVGVPGTNGTNGKTSYFHIKYSNIENPTTSDQMTESPSTFIGTYVDFDALDSNDPSKYTWYRFQGLQGEKGEQGIPGKDGDGRTSYLHIKYSNDGGQTFTSENGETVGSYIGTYTDFNVNDSMTISDYKWAKIKGEQGIGIQRIIYIYYVHTSKTEAPVIDEKTWTTTIPQYQEGKYLWSASKIYYTDGNVGYTDPQYYSEWEANYKAESAMSLATQTSEKFEWIVKKGSTSSSLQITNALIEAIANSDIKLKAKNITLEGYVTANDNFKILENGSIEAKDGKFEGEINAEKGKISSDLEVEGLNVSGVLTAESLNVSKINCGEGLSGVISDVALTVDNTLTDASNTFKNNGTFNSLQTAIESIPKNLNGYTVNITVNSILYENITVKGFNGGTLYIYFAKNNYGYVFGENCNAQLLLQGTGTTSQVLVSNYKTTGNVNMREGGDVSYNIVQTVPPDAVLLLTDFNSNGWGYTTYNGKSGWMSTNTSYMVKEEIYQTSGSSTAIQPSTLITQDGYNFAMVFRNCPYVAVYNLETYGKLDNDKNYAIGSIRGSYVDVESSKICGSENGMLASRGGRIFSTNTNGKVNGNSYNAMFSGSIYIGDGTTINGTIVKDNSSQIIYSENGITKDNTSNVGKNDNTTTATSSITVYSTGADTYRSTVYNNFKKDNTARQGDYGWGDCNGLWLFGNRFSKLKGKTITKLTITVNRIQGGIYGNVTATLKMHGYENKPSGLPKYISGWSTSITTPINTTKTIEITDATVLNAISNGTCKGFGVQGAYDKTHYAVFDGNCTIVATIQN